MTIVLKLNVLVLTAIAIVMHDKDAVVASIPLFSGQIDQVLASVPLFAMLVVTGKLVECFYLTPIINVRNRSWTTAM